MPLAGEVVRASDVTVLFAYKTVAESVTSSTTFQDDNDLTLDVEADAIYELALLLIYDGATAGDLKFKFTVPSGAAIQWGSNSIAAAGAAQTDDAAVYGFDTATNIAGARGTGGPIDVVVALGIAIIGGTAGAVTLQWAQNASSGTATTLKAGSFLRLLRVA